jgi:preprotein translocase subunit YajC
MRETAYAFVTLAAVAALLALAGAAVAQNAEAQPAAEGGPPAADTQNDAGADDAAMTEEHAPEQGDAANGEAPATEGDKGEETDGDGTQPEGKGNGGGGLDRWFLPIMIGGLVLLFLLMGRGGRKREKQRQEMLSALKKGDKVTTIGGIIGTVADLNEDEVTLRLDDNTRMRIVRRAVNQVGEGPQASGQDKSK